ncbi:hypothetical protein, partial [Xanthomonas translucens]
MRFEQATLRALIIAATATRRSGGTATFAASQRPEQVQAPLRWRRAPTIGQSAVRGRVLAPWRPAAHAGGQRDGL